MRNRGLRVQRIREFNTTLLGKWCWGGRGLVEGRRDDAYVLGGGNK